MLRTSRRIRLCSALLVCNLVFIWGNSMLPAQISLAFSQWVNSLVGTVVNADATMAMDAGIFRKLAHFTEFTSLGILLGWLFGMLKKHPIYPLLWGIAAAVLDETIQVFAPERGPGLRDVFIDSCGVGFGMILLFLGHTYFVRKHK